MLDARWPSGLVSRSRRLVEAAANSLRPGDLVLFTSGSGGRPRAVHRSLASWEASLAPLTQVLGSTADDVTWLPGHPTSTAVLYGAFHAASLGAPVCFAGEPRATAQAPERAAARVVHAVPSLVPGLLRAHRAGELPALRLIVTAGDAVPEALHGACRAQGVRLVAYYGAAELSFVAVRGHELDRDEEDGDREGDEAMEGYRPFPGVEVQVRDGLLWSRSPYQAYGYLQAPEESPEKPHDDGPLRHDDGPLRRDAQGFATVGDHAVLRQVAGGPARVQVLGRADAAVTVSGHTVIAEEVELALRAAPGIGDVVVVGVPDPVHGQRIAALWTGSSDADIRGAVAALPRPARPRSWHHLPALPRTTGGKPDRAAARRLAEQLRAPAGGAAHE